MTSGRDSAISVRPQCLPQGLRGVRGRELLGRSGGVRSHGRSREATARTRRWTRPRRPRRRPRSRRWTTARWSIRAWTEETAACSPVAAGCATRIDARPPGANSARRRSLLWRTRPAMRATTREQRAEAAMSTSVSTSPRACRAVPGAIRQAAAAIRGEAAGGAGARRGRSSSVRHRRGGARQRPEGGSTRSSPRRRSAGGRMNRSGRVRVRRASTVGRQTMLPIRR